MIPVPKEVEERVKAKVQSMTIDELVPPAYGDFHINRFGGMFPITNEMIEDVDEDFDIIEFLEKGQKMLILPKDAKIKYPKEEIVLLDFIDRPGELYATYVGDLIRCKDCIHFTDGRNGMCQRTHTRMNADDYCSRGRAK